jgi:Mn-dependent DtxR family transcriptional regulator
VSNQDDDALRESILERRALASEALLVIFRLTESLESPIGATQMEEVATEMGLDGPEVDSVLQQLAREGLAEWAAFGMIGLTAQGIAEAERRLLGTEVAEALAVVTVNERRTVEAWAGNVRRALDADELSAEPERLEEIRAQLDTIAAQLRSPRPLRRVLGAALKGLSALLLSAVASTPTAQLLITTVPGLG